MSAYTRSRRERRNTVDNPLPKSRRPRGRYRSPYKTFGTRTPPLCLSCPLQRLAERKDVHEQKQFVLFMFY